MQSSEEFDVFILGPGLNLYSKIIHPLKLILKAGLFLYNNEESADMK
jgi:hypothetical protein